MAKPNYSFEKRQREQAKKEKKKVKEREKADRKSTGAPGDGSEAATPDETAGSANAQPAMGSSGT